MTGRARIYMSLQQIFFNNPIWGNGYGNEVVKNYLGYGNVQNGFFDIVTSYGLVGVAIFLLLIYNAVKSRKNNYELSPILMFIYAMIICGTVEINFSIFFLIALSVYKWREKGIQ